MISKTRNFWFIILPLVSLSSCISISSSSLELIDLETIPLRQKQTEPRADFWKAMSNLDLGYADQYPDSTEQHLFASALHLIMGGQYNEAIPTLEHLVDTSSDSLMVERSGKLLFSTYMLTFEWEALIELDSKLPHGLDDLNTIAMIKGWSVHQEEQIHFPESPLSMKMEKSISGVPTIDVLVNGVKQTFWIDTGAEYTVLSSDIAEACGVDTISGTESKVGTSTDTVIKLWAGVIDKLEIEELTFEHHPVFIIPKEHLEFRLLKIFRILKVDGIIGWNAIQNLMLDMDYLNERITISKPEKNSTTERNLHFISQPFVTMLDTNGIPLQFFLDTGANQTALYPPSYAVFDTTGAEVVTAHRGGAGGFQEVNEYALLNQSLILGMTRIDFQKIKGTPQLGDTDADLIPFDGILGSDIAQDGRLIIDFQNGRCELKVPTN